MKYRKYSKMLVVTFSALLSVTFTYSGVYGNIRGNTDLTKFQKIKTKNIIAFTQNEIPVLFNNSKIEIDGKVAFKGVSIYVMNNKMLIPYKDLFQALNANFELAENTITATKESITISLQVNSKIADINGEEKSLDVAPQKIGNDIYVPIRFVGENFNYSVNFDTKNKIVKIKSTQDTRIVGPKGAKGDKGDKGDTGATGLQGAKGDKGDIGATGLQGSKGDTGATGLQGAKGDKGDKGDTGATGLQGAKGDKGDIGATGLQGVKGDKGDKGDTGATGLQGVKGDKGDTGATGLQGVKGDKGDKGDTGATGLQGSKGDKGDKGDTGATGLQGSKGDKGDKGDTGATGLQGAKGDKGDTGATGDIGPMGPQGMQGEKGDPGPMGQDSTIPGPPGPQGMQGAKGDTGAIGPQGPQGEKGDKGDTGAIGATGPAGVLAIYYDYLAELATVSDATIIGGADFQLSSDGPCSGIFHVPGTTTIAVSTSGIYEVNWSVYLTAGVGSNIALAVNGIINPTTSVQVMNSTGSVSGDALIFLNAGDVLTMRNNSAISLTQVLAPSIGASITIKYVSAQPAYPAP